MSFNDGDFLKIEYDAWRAADNSLVYTTDEKKAKENDLYNQDVRYGAQLAIVGKRNVIEGLDKALRGMNLNESKKVELNASEAFGERDPQLMQVMSINEFRKRDITPYPGMQVDLDGTMAIVKSVNSGRVLVDANHPLAGEKLTYEVKVVAKLENENEKVTALSEYYNLTPEKVEINASSVTVEYGSKVNKDANYFVNKSRFIAAAFTYLEKMAKVYVKEEYEKPSAKSTI